MKRAGCVLFILLLCGVSGFSLDLKLLEAEKARTILGDQNQPEIRVMFPDSIGGDFNGKQFEDVGLGGDVPLFKATDGSRDILSSNVRAYFRSRFALFSKSFDLYDADYMGGVSTFLGESPSRWELYAYHESCHMGDEVLLDTATYSFTRYNYSRETVRLTWYPVVYERINTAFSVHYVLRKDPLTDGKTALQCDLELPFTVKGVKSFFSVDLKANEEHAWAVDTNVQLRINLRNPSENTPLQAFTVEYYDGYSQMGQFYYLKEKYVSFGIIAVL